MIFLNGLSVTFHETHLLVINAMSFLILTNQLLEILLVS